MVAATELILEGLKRFGEFSVILRVASTIILLAFALFVSIAAHRSKTEAEQKYYVMLNQLWLGNNSTGLFITILYLWLATYLIAAVWPSIVALAEPLEQIILAATRRATAHTAYSRTA